MRRLVAVVMELNMNHITDRKSFRKQYKGERKEVALINIQ